MWLYLSLLAYKAPRYYVLIGAPLVAGAAVVLDRWFAHGVNVRRPRGAAEISAASIWAVAFCFGVIDATKHYASIALETLMLPPPRISPRAYDFLYDLFSHVDTFYQNLVWAGVFATLGIAAWYWVTRGTVRSASNGRGVAVALATISVAVALAQYGWFASHRTRYLEEVKESLPAMLGPGPVLLGPMAPLIAQDTEWPAHPYYGPPGHPGVLAQFGITHVVICGPGEARQFEERFPGLLDETVLVQSWPVQTLFSSTLEVRRLPLRGDPRIRNEYRESAFERGSEAVADQRWQDAIDAFSEFRASGGAELPELLSLESVCWFKLGDLGRAESLLRVAVEKRPSDALNYQNLAVLDLKRGDRASALDNLMIAIRIDPHSPQLEQMIQELTR
jgi:hypothetical protein